MLRIQWSRVFADILRIESDYGNSSGGVARGYALRTGVIKYLDLIQAPYNLDEIAARHGAKPAEVALAWVMAQPGLTAPIASATSIQQVDSLIRATELALSADDLAALEAASSASA